MLIRLIPSGKNQLHYMMKLSGHDLETSGRIVFCETHNRQCHFTGNHLCPCCNKRVCLCNYTL